MSFYFDDDDDDHHDQNFGSNSRGGRGGGTDNRGFSLLSQLSQQQQEQHESLFVLPSSQQQQQQLRRQTKEAVENSPGGQRRLHYEENNDTVYNLSGRDAGGGRHGDYDDDNNNNNNNGGGDFVCDNCGSRDSYVDDVTGVLTCSSCFTQSQAMLATQQEEFDYEEAVGMANKRRDGQLRLSNFQPTPGGGVGSTTITSDGRTGRRRGRALIPTSERDRTVPPPPLDDCLLGLQTVLQLGCKILCCDLMAPDPSIVLARPDSVDVRDGEEREGDDQHTATGRLSAEQLYREVSKTVKILWKTYLEAWMDGAEYYGALYPEFRFSFRDYFMPMTVRSLLHQTLAARAAKELKEKVENEPTDTNDDTDEDSSRSDHKDDGRSDNSEEILPDVIRLNRMGGGAHHGGDDRNDNDDEGGENDDDTDEGGSEGSIGHNDSKELDRRIGDGDASVSSELSVLTTKLGSSTDKVTNIQRIPRLLILHQKRVRELNKSKSKSGFGRREAALMLTPSMTTAIGMLWMAVAPYGVTAGKMVDWVSTGALPLLNSFSTLLSEEQQTRLKGVSTFFREPIPPTTGQLTRVVRCLHLTSGYEPPQIRVRTKCKWGKGKVNKGSLVRSDPLNKPGRVIRPSGVPVILANLIIELGLSQRVLNYSLAMMGLPVAEQTLFDDEQPLKKRSTVQSSSHAASTDRQAYQLRYGTKYSLPQQLAAARPDRLSDLSKIVAVIVVACKLIPDWEENHGYRRVIPETQVLERKEMGPTQIESTKRSRAAGRFIPWNEQHFRVLGNGRLEQDYLDYVEENVMKVDAPVLPKFVSMLKIPEASTVHDCNENSVVVKPTVTPNVDYLTFKKPNNGRKRERPYDKRIERNSFQYVLTSPYYLENSRALDPPLAALIEYMAYKSGTIPERILDYLVEIDKEIGAKDASAQTLTKMTPQAAYEKFILRK